MLALFYERERNIMKLDFYYVSYDYLEFLKDREKAVRGFTCIPNTEYASGNTKFFYGAVLKITDIDFFVPVSSKLHYKQDDMLIKGKDKKNPYLGTLRFRYMIPVPKNCLSLLVRDDLSSAIQGERVRKELAFCRKNRDKISDQAKVTYERVVNQVDPGLVRNSCDFKLLESAYLEWITPKGIELSSQTQSKQEVAQQGYHTTLAEMRICQNDRKLQEAGQQHPDSIDDD